MNDKTMPVRPVIRTFDAAVPRWDSPETRKSVAVHVAASHVAIRSLVSRLRAMVAVRVDESWVRRWSAEAGTAEGVRLASVITSSWVGVETKATAPGLSDSLNSSLRSVDDAVTVVCDRLRVLGLTEPQVASFLADDNTLTARVKDETVWVSYLPTDGAHIPYVGWVGIDDRLTGTPDAPGSGAMAIPLANVFGRALGRGEKVDPQVPADRARRVLALLEDASVVTVGDLAAGFDPSLRSHDGDTLAGGLGAGMKGRAPAVCARLVGRGATVALDDPYTPARPTPTLRDHLYKAAKQWLDTWQGRAEENAAVAALPTGHIMAGVWLAQAVDEGMPGVDFVRGPFTDLAVQAASVVATHRAKVFARAAEWANASADLDVRMQVVDREALAQVDGFVREHSPGLVGPVVIADSATRFADDVLAAWDAMDAGAPARLLVDEAKRLGATWEQWWAFLAQSPLVRAGLRPVMDVHSARRSVWRLAVPTFTRPHAEHAPRETTYGDGYWSGRLNVDGTLHVTIWDGTTLTNVRGMWRSARATKALGTKATTKAAKAEGAVPVTRLDATSLLAAGVDASTPVAPSALVDDATFSLKATEHGLHLRLAVPHTPARATVGALPAVRTVMGVTLGMRRDATFAVWRTVADRLDDLDATTVTVDGRTKPARRVGPATGDGPWFAHPVREGSIRANNGSTDRWATTDELGHLARTLPLLDGLRVPLRVPDGKITRGEALRVIHRVLLAAMRAQRLLAGLCHEPADSDLSDRLERLWPVPDGADPSVVWTNRTRVIASLATFAGTTLMRSTASGLSAKVIDEVDTQLRILRTLATWPTPSREKAVRHSPEGYAANLLRRRENLRRAWAKDVASRIVKTALTHGVDVVAFSEDTGPAPSRATFTSQDNSRLAAWAHRDVVERTSVLAELHGLRVVEVAAAGATYVPTSGEATVPVLATPLSDAVRFTATSPQWARFVGRARRDVDGVNETRAARARIILGAATALDERVQTYNALPPAERADWLAQRDATTVHLPHPSGQHVVPVSSDYDTAAMRATRLMDRDVVTAHTVAWRGVRRGIRQG